MTIQAQEPETISVKVDPTTATKVLCVGGKPKDAEFTVKVTVTTSGTVDTITPSNGNCKLPDGVEPTAGLNIFTCEGLDFGTYKVTFTAKTKTAGRCD